MVDRTWLPVGAVVLFANTSMAVRYRRNGRGAVCPGLERYINSWVERKKEIKRQEERNDF
jgi:hypothetical protein